MNVRRNLALLAVAVVVLVACNERDRPEAGPSPTPTFEDVTTISPGTLEWLAVFETAEDPNDLEEIQAQIMDEAAEHIAISPAGCWEEVPDELGIEEDDYVAGVVAASPDDLEEAIGEVDREPIFEGQVTLIACQ